MIALRAAVATTALILCACETVKETSDGRPMPPSPRSGPVTPEAAPINAMAMMLGPKPLDTNGNSRPDVIQAELYLFAQPYPASQYRAGTLEFSIFKPGTAGGGDQRGGTPIRTWSLSPEQIEQMRSRSLVGPCYEINLSLLANGGSDSLPVKSVDLTYQFTPADGGPTVYSSSVQTISMMSSILEPGR